jgi:SAM-dependent methyltransferase
MRYEEIDWNALWQEARRAKSWKKKQRTDWDQRAAGFAARNIDSPYVAQILSKIPLDRTWSVLDVGCGPGTLSLPLAHEVRRVTAIDFSSAMLEELTRRASEAGCQNITAIQAAWEDDWEALRIAPHDVAIASRSLSVDDLEGALTKLDCWATKAVCITDRVGAGPFDPDLFATIGRPFSPGPDYIYTVNLLYTMGIHARVDFITLESARRYATPAEAIQSHAWMVDDLTPEESERLTEYVENRLRRTADGAWELRRRVAPQWALIWWRKDGAQ